MYLIIPRKVYIIICLHNAYYLKGLLPNFLAMVFEQVFFMTTTILLHNYNEGLVCLDTYVLTLKNPHQPPILQEMRAKLQADEPDIGFGELGRRLGEMWHSLKEEEKEDYRYWNE